MFRRKPAPDLIRGGIRFADKDMRQHEKLRRFAVILDRRVIQDHGEAL
jgi:hypothetical protein